MVNVFDGAAGFGWGVGVSHRDCEVRRMRVPGLGWGGCFTVLLSDCRLRGMNVSSRNWLWDISELSEFRVHVVFFFFCFVSVMNICIYWTVLYVKFILRPRILQEGYNTPTSSSHYPIHSNPIQAPNIPPVEEVSQFHQVKSLPPSVSPIHPSLMRWQRSRSWVRWHRRHRRRR